MPSRAEYIVWAVGAKAGIAFHSGGKALGWDDTMRRALTYAPVLLFCLSSCGLWGQGAKCDPLHPSPDSSYQYKDRGNRCEGFYVADVGASDLDLVSFQMGSIPAQLKPGEILKVSVPGQSQPVHVRALAIPTRTFYRMDALLQPGATLNWPVDDVLLPEHLNPQRLGVFAWKGDEANKIFVPVRLESSAAAASQPAIAFLTVRPSFDVEKIKWRSAPVVGQRCGEAGKWRDPSNLSNSQVLAGQPVKLSLAGLKGQYCINVRAEAESSNDWSVCDVRVEIPTE
jgi:hypothetical protein